jgi:hypothetical protein
MLTLTPRVLDTFSCVLLLASAVQDEEGARWSKASILI